MLIIIFFIIEQFIGFVWLIALSDVTEHGSTVKGKPPRYALMH